MDLSIIEDLIALLKMGKLSIEGLRGERRPQDCVHNFGKEDRVVGDMGGSLTRFPTCDIVKTAAWELYEKNRQGSLGVRDEHPPFTCSHS